MEDAPSMEHPPPIPPTATSPESWEQLRRSVAMLSPGAWALRREQALAALTTLIDAIKK
jgi:hypothetical protein